jgi:hypothetical protein
MKYPVAIEPGASNESWGVAVPDLAGCFSAGDRCLDEAIENVKQAIQLWIEVALDRGQEIPKPSSLRELQKKKEFKGWAWAVVEINTALLFGDAERINISMPKKVLARLDAKAKKAGENRSAFIARLALTS